MLALVHAEHTGVIAGHVAGSTGSSPPLRRTQTLLGQHDVQPAVCGPLGGAKELPFTRKPPHQACVPMCTYFSYATGTRTTRAKAHQPHHSRRLRCHILYSDVDNDGGVRKSVCKCCLCRCAYTIVGKCRRDRLTR